MNDEPILTDILFNFERFGGKLTELLLEETFPTPFAIGLDGEWGSGKSTLLRYTENIMEEKIGDQGKSNWKIIYFNAWKYEKLDPVKSLMQIISTEYKEENTDWKNIAKNYGFVGLSAGPAIMIKKRLPKNTRSDKNSLS